MNVLRTGIASVYLALCLLLGGASAGGALANGVLQVVAVLVILIHVWARGAPELAREGRWLVGLFIAFATIAAAQLVPLPFEIWSGLPGRETTLRSLQLIGVSPDAMPASLDPRRTFSSLLWLLPPAAMFLVSTRLTRDERSMAARVLLAIAVVSIAFSAVQMFNGGKSHLYTITTAGRGVGFFANANHLATLLLCSLPFAGVFMARADRTRRGGSKGEGRGVIFAAIAAFIGVGVALNGSLAGYVLLIPTAIMSFILYRRAAEKKIGLKTWSAVGVAALLVVGFSVAGPLSSERFASKFDESNPLGRKISVPTTLEAARDFLPVGSGLGTFRDVYRTYEPTEDITAYYVNHAHNDYAEVALELGVPGLLALLGFLLWWLKQSWKAWRSKYDGVALARAGSIAIGVVVLHSLVDYPIRTSAIATVVAMCAAFMIQPPPARRERSRGRSRQAVARHMDADEV
ncbi:MAG TPA: O-antigen ligase family protein [Sphingomonadaceae bacterium]|nr:O-antigen ligase family protein [Sphingomonadaceae bacterium]